MIIDTHTHNFTENGKTFTPDDLVASMDEAGIDYSLLIADSILPGGTSTEQAIAISEKYPRIKPIGCLSVTNISDGAIGTLFSYLKQGKIHAVKLYPGYENYYLTDKRLNPFFQKMQELGFPVVIHTGFLMAGLPGLLRQAQPLYIDDLANTYPNLKIVMAHFGNPWIVDAAAVMLRNKNVYADLSGYFKEFVPISKEAVDFFVQDLQLIRNIVGDAKRFIFATDWPLYSQKEYLEAVQSLTLSSEEQDLIFWKNAKELFKLNV